MRDSLSARVSPTRTAQKPFAVTVSESSPGRGGGGGVSVGDDGVVRVGGAVAGALAGVGAAGGSVVVSRCRVVSAVRGPDESGSAPPPQAARTRASIEISERYMCPPSVRVQPS